MPADRLDSLDVYGCSCDPERQIIIETLSDIVSVSAKGYLSNTRYCN